MTANATGGTEGATPLTSDACRIALCERLVSFRAIVIGCVGSVQIAGAKDCSSLDSKADPLLFSVVGMAIDARAHAKRCLLIDVSAALVAIL